MSFETLFTVVEAALTGSGGVKALQSVLATHQSNFLQCGRDAILRKPHVKDSVLINYRQHLDAGQVRLLNDRLGVQNESYCQALLLEATTQSLNYGYAPTDLAEFIHYRPRVFLFNSLREILKARTDDSQPYEIRTLLVQFVSQLLVHQPHGLLHSLLSLLQSFGALSAHSTKTRGAGLEELALSNKYLTPHSLKEAKLVAECVFYLIFCDPPGSTLLLSQLHKQGHLKNMIGLLESFFTPEDSLLHSVWTTVLFTVQTVFLLALGSDRPINVAVTSLSNVSASASFASGGGAAADEEVLSSSFLETMDHSLDTMKNKEAKAALQVAFVVLVRRRGPSVCSFATEMSASNFSRSAVQGDAFPVLAALLDHPSYIADEDNLEAFGIVVDRLLTGLIFAFLPELSELKRGEEEQLAYEKEQLQRMQKGRQQMGVSHMYMDRQQLQQQMQSPQLQLQLQAQQDDAQQEDRPKRFTQFMALMQNAYRGQPVLAEKYWDFRGEKDAENKGLHYFLGMAGRDGWQVRTPAGFCSYLDMLSSFASGADNNSYYGFMFVKTGLNEFIRLSKFFDVLTSYATDIGKGAKLDRLQEDVALSILRFLQAILIGSEEVRRLLADSRERPLDVLKSLLMTNVKPRVKAAVLDTLRAFAETPAIAPTVWMLLEVSGIMANTGIGVELLDETNLQCYAETIAFLQLVERLLSVSDARSVQEITAQFRQDGSILGPYIHFVVEDVFLKNDTRTFKNPTEKWRIFSLSLQIFLQILQRFDAIDFRPNATEAGGASSSTVSSSGAVDVTNLRTVLSIATNPFYELMTLLLDGYLLDRVLAVIRVGVTNTALESARFAKGWGKTMEDACLAALCIVEEVGSKEEFFEDLLDILDDWDQRKLDAKINPLAHLLSPASGEARLDQNADRSFGAGNLFNTSFGGGGFSAQNRGDRRVPEVLLRLESRSVRPAPLREYMLHQKGASLVAICNYVDYAINLKLPLHAVKILLLLQPQIPSLVSTLSQSGQLPFIRLAFMNRLEDVHPTVPVREYILQLLLASVKTQRPNLAQVLMGYAPYDVDEEPAALTAINSAFVRQQQVQAQQQLQQQHQQQKQQGFDSTATNVAYKSVSVIDTTAGADARRMQQGAPDASNVWDEERGYCLGLVLALLRNPQVNVESPELAQLCYRLIYVLSATNYTSQRILAFLRRSSHLFLIQHLNRLTSQPMSSNPASRIYQLDQLSWLLQTVALEIHVTASSGREFLAQGLLQELFTIPSAESTRGAPGDDSTSQMTESELLLTDPRSQASHSKQRGGPGGFNGNSSAVTKPHNRMKMVELLDVLDAFAVPPYVPMRQTELKVFRGVDVEACRVANANGRRVIDLVYLHRVLQDFLAKMHDQGPRSFIRYDAGVVDESVSTEADELKALMTDALHRNQFEEALLAKVHLFDSWKRVLEVTVIECYNNLGSAEVEPYMFELLEILLVKLTHSGTAHLPLLESMADTCLVLMAKLREQISFTSESAADRFSRTPVERLHSILIGALSCIVDKTPSSPSLRGTLYAFLVNYFQFAKHVRWPSLGGDGASSLNSRNGYALRTVGERLLDRLVGDCSSGPDSWRAISLACLDALIAHPDQETAQDLIKTLSRRGHLNFFCSLQRFEEPLRQCIRDPTHALNVLFVWESQLSLLIRVAQTAAGTLMLAQAGCLASVVDLSFVDSRPAVTLEHDYLHGAHHAHHGAAGGAWFPSLPERYEQAVYPIASLLATLLTSSEPMNADVIRHVFEFLSAHVQAVTDILQDNNANPPLSSLRLLRAWVSVFSALAPYLHRPGLSSELQRHAAHFRDLLLNLAHKYAAFPDVAPNQEAIDDRGAEVLRLRHSLLSYFRRSMVGDGEHALIFSPHLKEDCSRPPSKNAASLSLLAYFLFHSSQARQILLQLQGGLEAQLHRAQRLEMLPGEIAKLLAGVGGAGATTADASPLSIKRQIVMAYLTRQIKACEEQRNAHQFVLENCLMVLLKHVFVYCKQNLKEKLLRAASTSDRVGLLAVINRLPTEDPVVFELCRRIRNALER